MSTVIPTPRHDGLVVHMDGRDWTIPPLTLAQLRKHADDLLKVKDITPFSPLEEVEPAISVIHAAMSRNYPDLTKEQLEDILDVGNVGQVMMAVCGMSGLVRSKEAPAEGEAQAGQ